MPGMDMNNVGLTTGPLAHCTRKTLAHLVHAYLNTFQLIGTYCLEGYKINQVTNFTIGICVKSILISKE